VPQLRRLLALEADGGGGWQADAPGLLRFEVALGHGHQLDHQLVGLARVLGEGKHAVRQQHHPDGALGRLLGKLSRAIGGEIESRHDVGDHHGLAAIDVADALVAVG
jgi:hypothetical protein